MPRPIVISSIVFVALVLGALAYFSFSKKPLPTPEVVETSPVTTVIGKSVEGRDIEAYTYGKGDLHLAFIGGIHGGYEWNTTVLAYEFIDYLDANLESIPENLTVTVIPNANPDGIYKIIGKEGRFSKLDVPTNKPTSLGRFNANGVDLNRNFDCQWKPKGTWRNNVVSAGTKVFSEPEAIAIRDFVLEKKPRAVIFWHSQSDTVYASQCETGILPETLDLMNIYAKAAKYKAVPSFDAYEISGDAESWLASIGIPSITVELKTHETVEFEQNLAGIKAIFEYYQ